MAKQRKTKRKEILVFSPQQLVTREGTRTCNQSPSSHIRSQPITIYQSRFPTPISFHHIVASFNWLVPRIFPSVPIFMASIQMWIQAPMTVIYTKQMLLSCRWNFLYSPRGSCVIWRLVARNHTFTQFAHSCFKHSLCMSTPHGWLLIFGGQES